MEKRLIDRYPKTIILGTGVFMVIAFFVLPPVLFGVWVVSFTVFAIKHELKWRKGGRANEL